MLSNARENRQAVVAFRVSVVKAHPETPGVRVLPTLRAYEQFVQHRWLHILAGDDVQGDESS